MADKREYVDLISAATRQSWKSTSKALGHHARADLPELAEEPRSRLSHWPPERLAQWRLDILKPWKKRNDPRT